MNEYPEWATYAGYPAGNDRWTDSSPAALLRRKKEDLCQLAALKKLKRASLRDQDLVNYELLLSRLELEIAGHPFPGELLPLSQMEGVHSSVVDTLANMPTTSGKDSANLLSRLEKAHLVIEQGEYWLREGLRQKIMPPRLLVQSVPAQIDRIMTADIAQSPLYQPFVKLPASQARAREVIVSSVYPALGKLRKFLVDEYIPAARESIAFKDLPNGAAWYALLTRSHTTTDLTPDQIHDIGLREVDRIAKEMAAIRARVKFKGDASAFHRFLLNDKQFYFTDKESLLARYRDISKRIDPELPRLFGRLPRLPYGVREIAEYKAKESATGQYVGGNLKAGRGAYFEANTYDLKARPTWGMETLTLHEAVPGHHLQIALAQELEGVPEFRKYRSYSAFVEGWGLYAESLGEDLGLLQDPYAKYGQLSYEMWRAVRLVVDTGMHTKDWSRQKAIDYMAAQLPKSRLECEVEVDRYIAWPGQALAYKIGQLKFIELRERARSRLGEKFSLREYHDEVLRNGSLPLDALERFVDAWIAAKLKK